MTIQLLGFFFSFIIIIITTFFCKLFCIQVNNKVPTALSPSIVETYSRLLVFSEMESLGIKGFLNQLLPKVFTQQAWGTLHTLLEIFSYRLHHIQAHYRLRYDTDHTTGYSTSNSASSLACGASVA